MLLRRKCPVGRQIRLANRQNFSDLCCKAKERHLVLEEAPVDKPGGWEIVGGDQDNPDPILP